MLDTAPQLNADQPHLKFQQPPGVGDSLVRQQGPRKRQAFWLLQRSHWKVNLSLQSTPPNVTSVCDLLMESLGSCLLWPVLPPRDGESVRVEWRPFPQRYVYPEPVNVILFGKRIFADVIKTLEGIPRWSSG